MNQHVTVTLHGTESIANSATTIREAARSMQMASEAITFALEREQQIREEWLTRLEAVLEADREKR